MHLKKKMLTAVVVSALTLGATPALALADSERTEPANARPGAADSNTFE